MSPRRIRSVIRPVTRAPSRGRRSMTTRPVPGVRPTAAHQWARGCRWGSTPRLTVPSVALIAPPPGQPARVVEVEVTTDHGTRTAKFGTRDAIEVAHLPVPRGRSPPHHRRLHSRRSGLWLPRAELRRTGGRRSAAPHRPGHHAPVVGGPEPCAPTLVFDRARTDPTNRLKSDEDARLDRSFTLDDDGSFDVTVTGSPRPGPELLTCSSARSAPRWAPRTPRFRPHRSGRTFRPSAATRPRRRPHHVLGGCGQRPRSDPDHRLGQPGHPLPHPHREPWVPRGAHRSGPPGVADRRPHGGHREQRRRHVRSAHHHGS